MILEAIAPKLEEAGFSIYAVTGVRAEIDDMTEQHQKQIAAILDHVARYGPPKHNIEKCRPLGSDLFELKTKDVRLPFIYQTGRVVIVTSVFVKKSKKTPRRFLTEARSRQHHIIEAAANGTLKYGQ